MLGWKKEAEPQAGLGSAVSVSQPSLSSFTPIVITNPVTISQVADFKPKEEDLPALVLADGSTYYGAIDPSSGLPHGLGIMLFKYGANAPKSASNSAFKVGSTFSAGDRYGGSWAGGQFCGEGVLVTSTCTYQGSFSLGAPHGQGHMLYARNYIDRMPNSSGSSEGGVGTMLLRGLAYLSPFDDTSRKPKEYIGQIDRVHLRHGAGMMKFYDGDAYDGNWSNNRRDGKGKLVKADGEVYDGDWERDEMHGYGKIAFLDGSRFKGMMVHGRRCGEGTMNYPNGDEYYGNFRNDRIDGHGTMRYTNGDVYEGQWKDGMRHGKGRYTLKKTGASITGFFSRGLIHGAGQVENPGVSLFVGEFDRGVRVRGTMFWYLAASEEFRDKICYQGQWEGEHMHGRGMLWYRNGDFFYGTFVRSRRHGAGNIRYGADGSEYSGGFVNNVRCGWGLLQLQEGSIQAGRWRDDMLVEGYDGEWDGKEFSGIGRLRLADASFLSECSDMIDCGDGMTGEAASVSAAVVAHTSSLVRATTSSSADTAMASAPVDEYSVEFLGLFKDGQRDGPGLLQLPVVRNGLEPADPASALTLATNEKTDKAKGKIILSDAAAAAAAARATALHVRRHVLKGSWRQDVLDCERAVWAFPGGEVYVGGFSGGYRHGCKGRLWLRDGSVYVGEWRNNVAVGQGVWFVKNSSDPVYCRELTEAEAERDNGRRCSTSRQASRQRRERSLQHAGTGSTIRLPGVGFLLGLLHLSGGVIEDGDREEEHESHYRRSGKTLVGYRSHYILTGAWTECRLPLDQYAGLVVPHLAEHRVAPPVTIAQAPSSMFSITLPAAAAVAVPGTWHVATPVDSPNSEEKPLLPPPASARVTQRYCKVPRPDFVMVSELNTTGLVMFPSGVILHTEWLGNYPRLSMPHFPNSPFDLYTRGLQKMGLLPASYVTPKQACGVGGGGLSSIWEEAEAKLLNGNNGSIQPCSSGSGNLIGRGNREGGGTSTHSPAAHLHYSPLFGSAHSSRATVVRPQHSPSEAAEASLPTRCTLCEKDYNFFRKAAHCALCLRSSCSACLAPLPKTSLAKPEVAALLTHTTQVLRAVQRKAQGGKSAEATAAAATAAAEVPCAWSDLGSQGLSIAQVCADCARSVRLGLRLGTMWIPMRMFASILSPAESTAGTGRMERGIGQQRTEKEDGATSKDSPGEAQLKETASETHTPPTVGLSTLDSPAPCPPAQLQRRQPSSPRRTDIYTMTPSTTVVYAGYTTGTGVPHIWGELWWGNANYYTGSFKMGERHGYGVQIMPNGERYVGRFRRNAWHGQGLYYCDDGSVLQAQFKRNRVVHLTYHGEMDEQLRRHGRGVSYDHQDGSLYNGEWERGERHGTGVLQLSDGTVYSGTFIHNQVEGAGKLVTTRSVYHGAFRDGLRHGKGLEFFSEFAIEGAWDRGSLNGFCRIYDASTDSVYETTYRNGNERDDCFGSPIMVGDEETRVCAQCGSTFSLFLRRHHCRVCGGVFCDACTQRRAVLPSHFSRSAGSTDMNNMGGGTAKSRVVLNAGVASSSGGTSGVGLAEPTALSSAPPHQLERVCDACYLRLEQRRMVAIKRYPDGSTYAGCWSQGHWVSRGLYCRTDGLIIAMDSRGQPLVASEDAVSKSDEEAQKENALKGSKSGKSLAARNQPEGLQDATPSRRTLDVLKHSSPRVEIDAFVLWWGAMASRCNLRVLLDVPALRLYQQLLSAKHRACGRAPTAPGGAKGAEEQCSMAVGNEEAQSLAACIAQHLPPPYPQAPPLCSIKMFVPGSGESEFQRTSQASKGDDSAQAAALRAARFKPTVIPPPPPAPSLLSALSPSTSSCLQKTSLSRVGSENDSGSDSGSAVNTDDEDDEGVDHEHGNRLPREPSLLPHAPRLEDYDMTDEELIDAIQQERLARFPAALSNSTDVHSGDTQQPHLHSHALGPLLPPTPQPPEAGSNTQVPWTDWGVRPVPRYRPRPSFVTAGSNAGSAAALSPSRKHIMEHDMYFSNPTWPPNILDVQQMLEGGKIVKAGELLERTNASTASPPPPLKDPSSSSNSEASWSSSDDEDQNVEGFLRRVWKSAGPEARAEAPSLAACVTGREQHAKKKKNKNCRKGKAAVYGEENQKREWLPAPMEGPFRFTVESSGRGRNSTRVVVHQSEIG